nr:MAG TPA: hypothetical protein [Crassvirales sp.]
MLTYLICGWLSTGVDQKSTQSTTCINLCKKSLLMTIHLSVSKQVWLSP